MNVMDHVELFTPEQLAYLDNLYVKKDACTARHEKTDEKINTLLVDNGKITTKLAFIQWLGGIAATASIGGIITSLYSVIFK